MSYFQTKFKKDKLKRRTSEQCFMPHLSLSVGLPANQPSTKCCLFFVIFTKIHPEPSPRPSTLLQLRNLGYTDSTDYVSTKTRRTQTARILRHRPLTARFLVSWRVFCIFFGGTFNSAAKNKRFTSSRVQTHRCGPAARLSIKAKL